MGTLRDRLESGFSITILQPRLPQRPRIQSAAAEVNRRLADCTPRQPDPYDLRETRNVLSHVASGHANINDVERKHLRRAPWVLFAAESSRERPLAEDQAFVRTYLQRLEAEGKTGAALALATGFLWYYPRESTGSDIVRYSIRRLLHGGRGPRAARLARADDRYDLFGKEGPETVARAVLSGNGTVDEALESAALSGQLAHSAFASTAFRGAVHAVRRELAGGRDTGDRLERLLVWSRTRATTGAELRYPETRIELAEALLTPFRDGSQPTEASNRIKAYLLEVYGDPRLDRSQWQGVAPYAEEVMLRWLVESTLEDFFRFVAHVAKRDSEADRMWYYRHAFWRAYLQHGVIEQAWVAFGAKAAREAEHRFRDEAVAYGQVRSGQNVQPNHAVLLLKVGDLTITEWSHVGKYRIWRADNQAAPGFYRREYRRHDLVTDPDRDGSHHGSESGRWQERLSRAIREETSISIPLKELLPNVRRKT